MEPIIHFTIPFIALILIGVSIRRALIFSILALLPDLDALFLIHRSFTHSIIILLIATIPLLLFVFRFKWVFRSYYLPVLLSISSHLFLDVFTGYTPILWPLHNYSVWIQAELNIHIGSFPGLTLNTYLLMEPIVFHTFQSLDAPLFTGEGLVTSITLLIPVIVKAMRKTIRNNIYC